VVVDDLDAGPARSPTRPFEADPPLIVDANAVLALAISLQRLEPIAGQVEVGERGRRVWAKSRVRLSR
jgi:hypothetical protein